MLSGVESATTSMLSRRRRRASRWFSWTRARMTECSTFVLSFSSACSRRRRATSSSVSHENASRAPGGWSVAVCAVQSAVELVTQVDGTVSGCLADASHHRDVHPGELGLGWCDGAVKKVADSYFEL